MKADTLRQLLVASWMTSGVRFCKESVVGLQNRTSKTNFDIDFLCAQQDILREEKSRDYDLLIDEELNNKFLADPASHTVEKKLKQLSMKD